MRISVWISDVCSSDLYRAWLGTVTPGKTIPALKAFVEDGGSLIAMGGSAQALAQAMDLPVEDAVAETVDGKTARPPRSKFYVPGALVEASVDRASPFAYGVPDKRSEERRVGKEGVSTGRSRW